jgi:polyisoprenoid-binding protein YceI
MNVIARWSSLIVLAGLIAGCSNPAADVTAAKVGDAQPVAEADPAEAIETSWEVAGSEAASTTEGEAAAAPAAPTENTVAFDGSNAKIDFVGSKLVGGSHDGGFKTFTGQFVLAPETGEVTSVSTTIDMNSLWSDNDNLTGHLKNQDFFEVETYPESEFVSTAIAPASSEAEGATHEVTGNLTMHGVTKSVTFPATVAVTDETVALDSEFKIDRTIWGIVYGAESDVRDRVINKEVVIRLDIDAPRGAAEADATE